MPTPLHVLILEDRPADAKLITRELVRAGYEPTWERVDTEAEFLAKLAVPWDIILSDYEMPQFDAPRALELLRQRGVEIPVIIISGTIGEDTAVAVMKLGATDYLLKDRLARLGTAIAQALQTKQLHDDKRRVVQELRASEERFRQLASAIQEVFWLTDAGMTQVLYISPAYERIWGRSCASLYAAPRTWLEAIHPDDRERVRTAALTKMHSGTYDENYRVVHPDGTVRWIHDKGFPIRDAGGEVYRVAGVAEDITEGKRLQDQFHQAQKMEAVGQLAGGVAHDFNNILTAVLGFSELLLSRDELPPPATLHVQEIQKAGYRAATLTRQLLAFSRHRIHNVTVIDPNVAIIDIERMLHRLVGENIELTIRHAPTVGRVKLDPSQLEQILVNLVVNARDAITNHGQITITTANVTLDDAHARRNPGIAAGHYVSLEVHDTGSGMTDEVKAHLFEPFFTTKEPGRGTGLGLATCYGIAKQCGGHIIVTSRLGHGTTFQVRFPRVDAPAEPAAPRDPTTVEIRGTETLLFVEDDRAIREVCKTGLSRLGYDVLVAVDGAQALELFQADTAGKIRLVLTDLLMPRLNGMQLLTHLRKLRPGLPVIFMSGYSDDILKSQGGTAANVAFLEKPYTLPALAECIRASLAAAPVSSPPSVSEN